MAYQEKQDKPIVISPIVFNDKKGLAALIRDDAMVYAEQIMKYRGSRDNYTQIRKYYDELVRIQQQAVGSNEEGFKKFLPSIYIVAAKASYAISKKALTQSFGNFIEKNVKSVNKKEDLNDCIMLFEAVLGYLKFYDKKNN